MPGEWVLLERMAIAAALGYAIGFEREWRAAGERTFALIALGTAGLVALGTRLSPDGVSRIVQGVGAGVGVIGAGLIFRTRGEGVQGLTTAAAVWAVAAIGAFCGQGLYIAAVGATVIVVLILELEWIPGRRLDPDEMVKRQERRGSKDE